MTNKKLYSIWRTMVYRCHSTSERNPYARYYRDAGITVCDEWRGDYKPFEVWALSNGYREGLSIDRIDPYGNYEPGNCRWLSKSEHARIGKRREFARPPVSRNIRVAETEEGAGALRELEILLPKMSSEQIRLLKTFALGFSIGASR